MISPSDIEISGTPHTKFAIVTWATAGDGRGYEDEIADFLAAACRVNMRKHCVQVTVNVQEPTWRTATMLKPWVALRVYEQLSFGPRAMPLLFLDADARLLREWTVRDLPTVMDAGWRIRGGEDLSGTLLLPRRNRITQAWLRCWGELCDKAKPKAPPYHKVWGDQQLMRVALEKVDACMTPLPQEWCFVDRLDGKPGSDVRVYHTQASRRRKGRR